MGRSSADEQVESLKKAMASINVADLTQDELKYLVNKLLKFDGNKLLKFEEKLAEESSLFVFLQERKSITEYMIRVEDSEGCSFR
ncbi:unnamed protein product [Brassica napus]|uniref:(rape) hypothetical protein n=1 Tax=Brassica napus TaxID=3708 RepID=A0A816JX48_BRANA|nr:unnamed protein product [Brassica napus]